MAMSISHVYLETHSLLLVLVQVFGYREEKLDRLKLGTVAHILEPVPQLPFSPRRIPVVETSVPEAKFWFWKFGSQFVLPLENLEFVVPFLAH